MSQPMTGSIQSTVESISPERALSYLKYNGSNRPYRPRLAERYAETMRRGAWLVNGEGIILSESGKLLDGQHRLHAVTIAGFPVDMLVIRGIPKEDQAFETLNSGVRRSLSDRLSGKGEERYGILAGALGIMHRYGHGFSAKILSGYRSLESDEAARLLEKHAGIRDWLLQGNKLKSNARFSAGLMTFILYAGSRQWPEKAEIFYEQCLDGVNLTKRDPAYWLRQRVQQSSMANKLQTHMMMGLAIKAWNSHVRGYDMGVLRFSPSQEEFPEIIGFPMSEV